MTAFELVGRERDRRAARRAPAAASAIARADALCRPSEPSAWVPSRARDVRDAPRRGRGAAAAAAARSSSRTDATAMRSSTKKKVDSFTCSAPRRGRVGAGRVASGRVRAKNAPRGPGGALGVFANSVRASLAGRGRGT